MSETYQLKYLTGRRLKIFLAIADRIIPPDDESPGAGTLETAAIVDWAMNRIDEGLRRQLLILILAMDFLGFFFGGLPFTMNSDKRKDRQLAWMESGPIGPLRMGFFGLKSYVSMGYYTREDVWKTIGYEGPLDHEIPYPDETIRALAQGRMGVTP